MWIKEEVLLNLIRRIDRLERLAAALVDDDHPCAAVSMGQFVPIPHDYPKSVPSRKEMRAQINKYIGFACGDTQGLPHLGTAVKLLADKLGVSFAHKTAEWVLEKK